jgi:ABC-2 type transport system ATP-binding protein
MLRVTALNKTYGRGRGARVALDSCTFSADRGEIVGVIGPNGAGKTTLLGILAGRVPASSGSVEVAGRHAGTVPARRSVAFASDPPLAPPELSGTEWLRYLASHHAPTPAGRLGLVGLGIEVGELEAFCSRPIGAYSRGMGQRLALAAAVAERAELLLLDETLAGVDPLVQRRLRVQIANQASQGRCIVIASHDLAAVERLATRVLVLWRGRIIADIATARLLAERVAEITLSGSALAGVDQLIGRYPGARRTGHGLAVPLARGLTIEQLLIDCHEQRIPVAATRVRYRALEDLLVAAEAAGGRTCP